MKIFKLRDSKGLNIKQAIQEIAKKEGYSFATVKKAWVTQKLHAEYAHKISSRLDQKNEKAHAKKVENVKKWAGRNKIINAPTIEKALFDAFN